MTPPNARAVLTAALALSLSAWPAMAQERPSLPRLPADAVREIMETARDHALPRAKLPDGSAVGPETPEQRGKPLLDPADGEHIIQLGIVSGLAEKCGLDWERNNFAPLMRWVRSQGLPPKAVAYVAVLHGTAMSIPQRDRTPCTPKARAGMTEYMKMRWSE